jgi:hypothetical protein
MYFLSLDNTGTIGERGNPLIVLRADQLNTRRAYLLNHPAQSHEINQLWEYSLPLRDISAGAPCGGHSRRIPRVVILVGLHALAIL